MDLVWIYSAVFLCCFCVWYLVDSYWSRTLYYQNLMIKAYYLLSKKYLTDSYNKSKHLQMHCGTEVAQILSDWEICDAKVIVAGILHNIIDETDTSFNELKHMFGKEIALMVMECSSDKALTRMQQKKLQLINIRTASCNAKIIKFAEKFIKLKSLLHMSKQTEPPIGYIVWCYAQVRPHLNEITRFLKNTKTSQDFKMLWLQLQTAFDFELPQNPTDLENELEKYYVNL